MRLSIQGVLVFLAAVLAAAPVLAATVRGVVSDVTGAALPGSHVVLRGVATGQESETDTGADGRFQIDVPVAGTYLVIITRPGFSEAARTVVIDSAEAVVDVGVQLDLGVFSAAVSVTAARSERETRQIPLHVETVTRASIEQDNTLSTGDGLTTVANITPVGNGPFGVRPRLRGLDSTRLLVLVDGERLNTARQATDRQGAEVGLISPDAISRMEIVNGAGTLLYGSDALAGTINIITNEPGFSSDTRLLYGFNAGAYADRLKTIRDSLESELRALGPPIYERLAKRVTVSSSRVSGCFGEGRAVLAVSLRAGSAEWTRERVVLVDAFGRAMPLGMDDLRFKVHDLLHAVDVDGDGLDDVAAVGRTFRAGGTTLLRYDEKKKRLVRLAAGFVWEDL